MKRINKDIWKKIKTPPLFSFKTFKALIPIFFYLVFSISNVVFLALSMKHIPEAIAYAIWSGIVIGGAAAIDQVVSKTPIKPMMIVFILMILMGVIGLRLGTT